MDIYFRKWSALQIHIIKTCVISKVWSSLLLVLITLYNPTGAVRQPGRLAKLMQRRNQKWKVTIWPKPSVTNIHLMFTLHTYIFNINIFDQGPEAVIRGYLTVMFPSFPIVPLSQSLLLHNQWAIWPWAIWMWLQAGHTPAGEVQSVYFLFSSKTKRNVTQPP